MDLRADFLETRRRGQLILIPFNKGGNKFKASKSALRVRFYKVYDKAEEEINLGLVKLRVRFYKV